jgi:hypothetical protein
LGNGPKHSTTSYVDLSEAEMTTTIASLERISLEPPTPSFVRNLERRLLDARRAAEMRARAAPPREASALLRRFETTLAKLDALVVRALSDGLVTQSEAKAVLLATSRASRFTRRG